MSDFTSDFWSHYVTVIDARRHPGLRAAAVADGAHAGAAARRQHHRPRLGRGPARDEQPDAALVDGAVRASPSCSARLPGGVPGPGQLSGQAGLEHAGRVRAKESTKAKPNWRRCMPPTRRRPSRAGRRSRRHGHRRAPVPEQLRAVPRLGRARQQGLPQPRPTATGCTAARPRRSTRPSPSAASARCRRWPRRSARPRT